MPVGELLRRMDSREIAEWRAFFMLRNEEAEGPKVEPTQRLRAMFGDRVVKKGK